MKHANLAFLILTATFLLATRSSLNADSTIVGDFLLRDQHGHLRSLEDCETPLVVIAFLGTECPLARLYGPRLAELSERFDDQATFFGVNANVQDSLTEVVAYANRHEIEFPILMDNGQELADELGAQRTPQVFLLDQNRIVRYSGRIDDQYGISVARNEPQREDLAIAIEEVLAGKPVSIKQTQPVGCLIGRQRDVEPTGAITYSRHIAAILNRRCVECHREGQIAPFPLTTYEELEGWEAMIAEVVTEQRMPPWNANPKYGHFKNDARLTGEEKQQLLSWIENGCPEGDPAELPDPPTFPVGWRIPEPDLVIKMREEPFEVPATGVVKYKYFRVDPGFDEDKYVKAVEARPGNTSVVHHIIAYVVPPGEKKSGLGQMLVGYAPGTQPIVAPPETAILVPKDCELLFELHYTPNGTEQTDLSYIGLKFADPQQVTTLIQGRNAINRKFEIPPEAADHIVTAKRKIKRDIDLLTLTPHMHVRGAAFRYEVLYPDGQQEVLLDVPEYDFNWQLRYELAEPKRLPEGSQLICTAHYDNSAANPNNPDPSKSVTWGDQSFEEMMIGFFTYLTPVER